MAEKMMLSIAAKCLDLGAKCIGHIKSHIRTDAGTIKADTIGVGHGAFSTGRLTAPVKQLYVAINSIVQGIPEDAVKAATLEGMHEIAQQQGVSVVKEKEHTYFDEFDFVTSKQDYLKQLEDCCAENDVLLIIDEVAMGFGRTGKRFAFNHAGIDPEGNSYGTAAGWAWSIREYYNLPTPKVFVFSATVNF